MFTKEHHSSYVYNLDSVALFNMWWALLFLAIFGNVAADEFYDRHAHTRSRLLERHPRDIRVTRSLKDDVFGTAASFSGNGEFIRWNADDNGQFPSKEFTLMFWIKPEGGQSRYTPIIGKQYSVIKKMKF